MMRHHDQQHVLWLPLVVYEEVALPLRLLLLQQQLLQHALWQPGGLRLSFLLASRTSPP